MTAWSMKNLRMSACGDDSEDEWKLSKNDANSSDDAQDSSDEMRENIVRSTRAKVQRLENCNKAFDKIPVQSVEEQEKKFGDAFEKPHLKSINTSQDGKKSYACCFCIQMEEKKHAKDRKPIRLYKENIIGHFQRQHFRGEEIVAINALPPAYRKLAKGSQMNIGQKHRERLIKLLRDRGSFLYNGSVGLDCQQPCITARRSRKLDCTLDQYSPCLGCKALYKKDTLKKHMVKCVQGIENDWKHVTAYKNVLNGYIHPYANEFLKVAYQRMQVDLVGTVARCDFAITVFGNDSAQKNSRNVKNYIQVRSDARMLANILIGMKEKERTWKIEGKFKPKNPQKKFSNLQMPSIQNTSEFSYQWR